MMNSLYPPKNPDMIMLHVLSNGNSLTDLTICDLAPISQLVHILGLHIPPPETENIRKRCVVFVGPHEHHSNMLPWREAPGCDVWSGAFYKSHEAAC